MNLPDIYTQQRIDSLTDSPISFALYRLPWTDECYMVLQTTDEVEQLEDICSLNGKRGFVMAPFLPSAQQPLVVIRPDITAYDWKEIGNALKVLPATLAACPTGHANPPLPADDDKATYLKAFQRFITPLCDGLFQKLVLSRATTLDTGPAFSPLRTFIRACNSYPRMMIYLCHTPISGTWIGSTPEILLSGQADNWHTVALAGTMPMQGEVMPTQWDQKNQQEQTYVADYVRRIVKKFGNHTSEKGPYTARAGQLVHLKTDFHFTLKNTDRLGNLLNELHPTPAVCGLPKDKTRQFILANEGYDRSYYSGFTGWLDPEGHTDLYVNLRCMAVNSCRQATLYAGGGILDSSEAETEWEETEEKMKTMRNILNE